MVYHSSKFYLSGWHFCRYHCQLFCFIHKLPLPLAYKIFYTICNIVCPRNKLLYKLGQDCLDVQYQYCILRSIHLLFSPHKIVFLALYHRHIYFCALYRYLDFEPSNIVFIYNVLQRSLVVVRKIVDK